MLLLSRLDATTGTGEAAAYMFVLGVGLGLTMQVLVLAVQNAVPYAQLGMATSSATLFRSIGGSLGTAILGAIFANRLSHELATVPGARTLDTGAMNPAQLESLPRTLRDAYVGAFTDSLSTVFVIAGAVVAVAFLLAWFLEERPLRRTIEETTVGEAFAPPQDTDSLHEITTQLSRLVGRERTRRFIEGVIEEAEVDMTPAEAWLLGRVDDGAIPAEALNAGDDQDRVRLAEGALRLRERGMVDGGDGLQLTDAGTGLRERLVAARQRRLASLVADWEPEAPEVDAMIARLSEELERSGSA